MAFDGFYKQCAEILSGFLSSGRLLVGGFHFARGTSISLLSSFMKSADLFIEWVMILNCGPAQFMPLQPPSLLNIVARRWYFVYLIFHDLRAGISMS